MKKSYRTMCDPTDSTQRPFSIVVSYGIFELKNSEKVNNNRNELDQLRLVGSAAGYNYNKLQ